MKFLKKILLFSLVSSLSFLLAACSTLTPNNAMEKIIETNKNIKSVHFNSTTMVETVFNEQTNIGTVTIDGFTTKEPHTEKINIKNEFHSSTSDHTNEDTNIYLNNDILYISKDDSWLKYTGNFSKLKYKNLSNLEASDKILEIYKKIANDFQATTEGDTLVLNYKGSGDYFKDLLVEIMNATTPGEQLDTNTLNNIEFKNVEIKYIVKKADFLPISSEITMNLASKNDTSQSLNIKQKINYSDINSVQPIEIPKEVTDNISQTIDH